MAEILRAVKGMNDLFEEDLVTWRLLEQHVRDMARTHGYGEIRTPIVEETALFVRGVGEGTDIVEKEIYTLEDRDGKSLALRPENTAGVVRAMLENSRFVQDADAKVFYMGPMFRRERPQKGRYRQFWQLGVEAFGIASPSIDVEVMVFFYDLLAKLGLSGLQISLNTLGQPEERDVYVKHLRDFLHEHEEKLCTDCKRRLHKNALRILDCKNPSCGAILERAPAIREHLGTESQAHFDAVCEGLSALKVPFQIAPRLVRGLDYYTRTVFEVLADTGLGAQNAVGAGGRYDHLVKDLGGPHVSAFGFAAGLDRIVLLMQEAKLALPSLAPDLVLVGADDKGREASYPLARTLRTEGFSVDVDHQARSVKAQMRKADRLGAKTVLVIGSRELEENKAQLKVLKDGTLHTVLLRGEEIAATLRTL